MRIAKLFLPGRFEDAYVYMGKLVVITEDKTLRECNLEKVAESLENENPDYVPVVSLMFSRNDWLDSSQFKLLLRNTVVSQSLSTAFDRLPWPYIELSPQALQPEELDIDIPARVILDMTIYNQRLYLGADSGLYHIDIDWRSDGLAMDSRPEKRTDARCMYTTARYGAVTASCGDEGLFTAVNDFHWYGNRERSQMRRVMDRSLRTAWLNYDIINYATATTPSLLHTSRAKANDGGVGFERERTVLTEIGDNPVSLSYLFDTIRRDYGVDQDSIQYTYNSNRMVFIHTWQGDFYSLGVQETEKGEPQVRFTKTYKGADTRILSAHWSKPGLIVETDNRVLLFAHGEWFPLVETEVLSVKDVSTITTFSKRCGNDNRGWRIACWFVR